MRRKRAEPRIPTEANSAATTTFGVRLTEAEKQLLLQAADLRVWTITSLLKNAALEKAAHIINTSTRRKLDFKGLAQKVADQVFVERKCRVLDREGQWVSADVMENEGDVSPEHGPYFPAVVSPWQAPASLLPQLQEAALYGGAEFLNMFLNSCEDITSRTRQDLPDPIDPNKIA